MRLRNTQFFFAHAVTKSLYGRPTPEKHEKITLLQKTRIMKTLSITIAAILTSFIGFAQTESDTTNIMLGDKQILVIEPKSTNDTLNLSVNDTVVDDSDDKNTLTHWDGIDVGVNMLLTKSGSMTMDSASQWLDLDYSRSFSWRFNIFEEKIRFYKDYVGLIVGAGLTYNSYGLKNNVRVQTADSSATYAVTIPDSIMDFSKNKLRASYVNVPLILEINTSKDNDKCFHIAAGVIGGWKMGSITKQKWENGGEKNEYRNKADYNLSPFTLDATARVGYRNFTVFATYGLTPLFQKDKGPEVYPVTVGLQLVPF
jgi:hypothetical protein